jgi:uncharacterized membrane protein
MWHVLISVVLLYELPTRYYLLKQIERLFNVNQWMLISIKVSLLLCADSMITTLLFLTLQYMKHYTSIMLLLHFVYLLLFLLAVCIFLLIFLG